MIPIADDVPRRGRPLALYGLLLANALVFLLELALPERELALVVHLAGVVPARFAHPAWGVEAGYPPVASLLDFWPFLTSAFLHAGWIHFLGNMWMLWIFGDNVEDRMGHLRFLAFYLLSGIASGAAHAWVNADSAVPALGASGAIAGVMGAYFLLFPRARIVGLFPIFFYPLFLELPAVFYIYWWFLTQFLSGSMSLGTGGSGGGVAWWAHVGGFLWGALTFWAFLRRRRPARARR